MKPFYIFLLSESILFPFLAGLVRLHRIKRSSYQPFFTLILAGVAAEVLSTFILYVLYGHNAVSNAVYALLEWLLIAWQFRVWGLLRNRKPLFYALLALPCLTWITENLIFGQIVYFSPYFQVVYCFLVVMFSINQINFMITHDYRNLFGNPTFLICIGFIIYFLYRIVFNWAYQSSLKGANETSTFIIMLFGYVNALTNIIFAIALLRIPKPQKFTLK
ncbi:MAG TPA: hypothetical protein VGM89_03020 [Puia sp.]